MGAIGQIGFSLKSTCVPSGNKCVFVAEKTVYRHAVALGMILCRPPQPLLVVLKPVRTLRNHLYIAAIPMYFIHTGSITRFKAGIFLWNQVQNI